MNLEDFDVFILDLDGTLIDSGKYHAQAFADAVLEQSDYTLSSVEYHEFFATHSTLFAKALNIRHGLNLDSKRVLERKRERVKEIFKPELFQGALGFLEHWFGKKPMALATNSPLSFVRPALNDAGITKFFDFVTTADEVKNRKPDPEIIKITIQKFGADPLRTLVFEDQLMGVEAARLAGAHVIGVDNQQPVNFPADVAVYSWNELLRL